MDTISFITDYESGQLDDDAVIAGFQELVDTGLVWQLQGSYGRMAMRLLEAGLIRKAAFQEEGDR